MITRYVREIRNGLEARIPEGESGKVAAAYARLGADLQQALIDAGAEEVLDNYARQFPGLTRNALEYFELFGLDSGLGGVDVDSLEGLIAFSEGQFRELMDERLVRPMRNQILQNVLGNRDRKEVISEIRKRIDEGNIVRKDGEQFLDHNINVFVGDSFVAYQAEVRSLKAEDVGLNEYIQYVGPLDSKTRPACQAMLKGQDGSGNAVWRVENFTTAIHPSLVVSPLIAQGGFNCRHSALYISEDYAREQGFNG